MARRSDNGDREHQKSRRRTQKSIHVDVEIERWEKNERTTCRFDLPTFSFSFVGKSRSFGRRNGGNRRACAASGTFVHSTSSEHDDARLLAPQSVRLDQWSSSIDWKSIERLFIAQVQKLERMAKALGRFYAFLLVLLQNVSRRFSLGVVTFARLSQFAASGNGRREQRFRFQTSI